MGLVNVGAIHSSISVVLEGAPVFTRDITKGGNTYTDAIMQKLGVSFDAGEAYKVGGSAPGASDVVPHEVPSIISSQAMQMAIEYKWQARSQ